ncbi:MAG: hypothetical protein GXX81_09860 [Acidobacteria bacterium]|nr:hypothetical protein [Acidobacteriota bacterium]
MRYGVLLMLVGFLPCLGAQEPPGADPAPYVERQEKEFRFYPGGKVGINLDVPGTLRVVGWKQGSVRMEAEKIVFYSTADQAREFLSQPPIRIRHNDTSATIAVNGAPAPPAILEVNLTLYVPSDRTDLMIQMRQGDLALEGLNGWIEASLGEGSVDVRSVSGYFSASTLNGDIDVEMSDRRWRGQEFAAMTRKGSVGLRLPEEYSAALQLETRNGKITVDYPPQEVEGELLPPEIYIKNKTQLLRASVGDGGAPVKITTQAGDVLLERIEKPSPRP